MLKRFVVLTISIGVLAGCAPPIEQKTNAQLWSQMRSAQSPLEIAKLEAELGVRQQEKGAGIYLGQKTSSAYQKKLYARTGETSGDRNCASFKSSAEAQKFFLESGGPLDDPHGLDRDGDGFACDWGKQLSRIAKKNAPRATPTATRSSSTCYVGKRGGTYTITASGKRNYSGC